MTIRVTHTGSLPRSQDTVDLIFAREQGAPYDQAAFDTQMTKATAETVGRQVEAGVDVVSDGETSKISYATYVKDRYTGFAGDSPRNTPADLKLFPSFSGRLTKDKGAPTYARPMCV
ncbi:MAG: epoxyalkane--coenzyme M transferase, partial [Pseudomonadota bacterium]